MYFAHILQEGGCDYTIGCGERFVELKAKTLPEATAEALEEYSHYADDGLESITIYEAKAVRSLDISAVRKERARLAQKVKEDSERDEYERLKAKFG